MPEIKYEPFKTVPYRPQGPIDPEWNKAIDREIERAIWRGSGVLEVIEEFENTPLARAASKC